MELPKYLESNKKGRNGLNILTKIVENELGWIVRPNHQEDDFGIDAFIDIIIDGYVTGKSIAIQIKSGNSYLKALNNENWNFKGDRKHLNYYLNHDIPVLIVLVDVDNEIAYWEICKVEYVDLHEKTWTLPIPKIQRIRSGQKEEILNHVPKTVDYVSQLDEYWKGNKLLSDSGRLLIFVGRDDINDLNYQPLIELISRICSNKYHFSKFRENIEIGIHGFDGDNRELYQIPEIKKWITNIFDNVPGLTYFLANDKHSQFLTVFVLSSVKLIEIDKGLKEHKVWVEYDNKDLKIVFDILFADLNDFTEAFKLSFETNKEISHNLAKCITGKDFNE
ncbi:MAG: DUF4365 and DUF1817 domain-containing protein [Salinivirgaceae bacterium]|nr:DUF4365 and DUF1817 domain-containing protein [Salinivirgaceae bacterium]